MHRLFNDLRTMLRGLGRSPSFVLTIVATLALGIGLNAAIFTVVDCVLLRPLGYRDADRIVGLETRFNDQNRSIPRLGDDDYSDLTRQAPGLEAVAHYQNYPDGVQVQGESLYLPVAVVSPQFAAVMGVEPIAGRVFDPSAADGRDVLAGASFVREHFGSAAAALGKAITYNGGLYTIVGVLPQQFSFPAGTALWFEIPSLPAPGSRTAYNHNAIGKRRSGVSEAQLDAQLASFSRRLQQTYPEDRSKSIEAVSLQEQIVGPVRPTLHLLMGAVGVILLIVCVNVMHVQLARATRQRREATIRTALGASRTALAGRALLEAGVLATLGCAAALVIAEPALALLVRMAPPDVPRLADVHLNFQVLVFSFAISLVTMGLAAVLPLWYSWQLHPAMALRQDGNRSSDSRGALRLRNGFIVAEVALTLMLSVGAILIARQLLAENRQELGFSPERLVTLDTHAILSTLRPVAKDDSLASRAAVEGAGERIDQANLARLDDALASIGSVPGVDAAGGIGGAPMGFGGSNGYYAVKGRQVLEPGVANLPQAEFRPVTPSVFRALGVPLLRGRGLAVSDRAGAPPVVLVSHAQAEQVFPGEDPLGKQIQCGYDERSLTSWATIVGVVGDMRSDAPGTPPAPTIYFSVAQHPREAPDMQLVVRTRPNPGTMQMNPSVMLETMRKRLAQTHPEIAVKATTMRENIGALQQAERFRTLLLGSFAAVSILLAAVGMYGVTAYTVAQRRFEFALRMAVGSTRGQVLRLVLRRALAVAAIGVVIGLGLSLALTRVLASLLGALPAFDGPAYALATLAVLVIATLATVAPARRAASTEPMQALRTE